jgi:hypothetical protein
MALLCMGAGCATPGASLNAQARSRNESGGADLRRLPRSTHLRRSGVQSLSWSNQVDIAPLLQPCLVWPLPMPSSSMICAHEQPPMSP